MTLYHGSNVDNLKELKPFLADHDRPYVYLTKLETIACLYLCNAVEKPYYWFPYGFADAENTVPRYYELYPNALREVSEGVSGSIYTVEASDDQVIDFPNIPTAMLGTKPITVTSAIHTDNAWELIQKYIREGRLEVRKYEDMTSKQLDFWYDLTAKELLEKDIIHKPDAGSYIDFIKNKLSEVWERYQKMMLTT